MSGTEWTKLVVRHGMTGCAHLDRLWWIEAVANFGAEKFSSSFNRKRDAVSAARKWAKRFGLKVEVRDA